jgi:hypothetical protein
MSNTSVRLSLPYLAAAQAQKHVTMNEALERLDAVVQLVIEEFDRDAPPQTPGEGQVWATGAAPTGDWTGQADRLAIRANGGWLFIAARDGWRAWSRFERILRVRETGAWTAAPAAAPLLDDLDGLGIGATHDATNRLSVAAPATLLNHEGAGHQLKINKAAATDTASLLFQTGFGGRAEMGTAGSDDFAIKVSGDGAAWTDAARFDAATGAADLAPGTTIGGARAYHAGNVLDPVAMVGALPSGGLIESGSDGNGHYARFADGTQMCWAENVDMGSILAAGSGTWDSPWRTGPVSISWARPFVAAPAASCSFAPGTANVPLDARALVINAFEGPGPAGWDFLRATRVGSDNHDVSILLSVLAIGRWT